MGQWGRFRRGKDPCPNGQQNVNVHAMRRRLVLTNEAARHPFRRSLPPVPPTRSRRDDDQDIRLFVLSFTAFFICFYSFLF